MKMTGAQAIIKALELEKIDTIFGYPGAAISPFYDALLGSSIRHILTRHEQGAAHAANGYARITGRVGVCVATSGPGATNLITGIANAYMDSIPIVAITGQVSSGMIGTDAFQEADITGSTAPFSKHNYLVKRADDLARVIKEAFHIAATGRPGPVVIDVPVDVQNSTVDFRYPEAVDIKGYKPTYKGHPMQIRKAAAALDAAERPVICVGGGVIAANASAEVLELAERRNIPVTTTLMGIGAIPSTHPLHFGMVGTHGNQTANYALHHADLVMILGARVGDRAMGAVSGLAKKAKIVHIDIDPAEIGKNINTAIPLVGDVKLILKELLEIIGTSASTVENGGSGTDANTGENGGSGTEANSGRNENERSSRNESLSESGRGSADKNESSSSSAEWVTTVEDYKKHKQAKPGPKEDSQYVNPKYLLSVLSKYLPAEAVIATEVGQNQIWAANNYQFSRPRTFITSGGLGTMGYGLPAAVGAKLGKPEVPVVVISGDGSFQMSMQELGTMKHYGIGVKIILFNNCRLGMVRELQYSKHGGRYSQVCLDNNPDFVALVAAYGFKGERISSDSQVEAALERLAAHDGPYLLECAVDPLESTL